MCHRARIGGGVQKVPIDAEEVGKRRMGSRQRRDAGQRLDGAVVHTAVLDRHQPDEVEDAQIATQHIGAQGCQRRKPPVAIPNLDLWCLVPARKQTPEPRSDRAHLAAKRMSRTSWRTRLNSGSSVRHMVLYVSTKGSQILQGIGPSRRVPCCIWVPADLSRRAARWCGRPGAAGVAWRADRRPRGPGPWRRPEKRRRAGARDRRGGRGPGWSPPDSPRRRGA